MDKKNHEGSFKKAIGPFSGISIVAGMVIGSGVYYLGSYVLERTGMRALQKLWARIKTLWSSGSAVPERNWKR